jgi:hypothetical protein
MESEKQIAANQRNAQQSTGPQDTTRTSRNATKHGLTARRITELDREGHEKMAELLAAHFRPVGLIEGWLVRQIALHMVRLGRAAELERACLAQQIQHNKMFRDLTLDFLALEARVLGQESPAPCALTTEDIGKLNDSVGRYETALENKLYRALHELERQQRRRQGENVPAPAAGDLNIHGTTSAIAPTGDGTAVDPAPPFEL